MKLKILATSDLHIGLKFSAYPEVQDQLIEARFTALETLVSRANDEGAHLFVVAGDLFDRLSAAKKDVMRAREILGGFHGGLTVVLPGNHDYLASGDSHDSALPGAGLWSRFDEGAGGNVLVLRKREPYHLRERYDINACLYPGPCTSKHSPENAIGWVRNAVIGDDALHVGIAHGSLEGVCPDFIGSYFPMTRKDLSVKGIDCWILGHTHLQWQDANIFYPGTPEPDGFDCAHRGSAWLLELEKGSRPRATSVACGTYRFEHACESVVGIDDLGAIASRYEAPEHRACLLRLDLIGRLPRENYTAIPALRDRVAKAVFCLCAFQSRVREEITPADIDAEFTAGSFPHRVLSELSASEADAEALQMAYELIAGVRS